MTSLVIGIGNEFRRDDGVGLAVAARVGALDLEGVRVLDCAGEPSELIDAWADVALAVVVDAAAGADAVPGRVRRWAPGDETAVAVSSHQWGLPATYALGQALRRLPERLVVFTVDAADVSYGTTLSRPVAAAVPDAVAAVLSELEGADAGPSAHDR